MYLPMVRSRYIGPGPHSRVTIFRLWSVNLLIVNMVVADVTVSEDFRFFGF